MENSIKFSGGVLAATQWLEGIDISPNLAGVLQGASLELDEFSR